MNNSIITFMLDIAYSVFFVTIFGMNGNYGLNESWSILFIVHRNRSWRTKGLDWRHHLQTLVRFARIAIISSHIFDYHQVTIYICITLKIFLNYCVLSVIINIYHRLPSWTIFHSALSNVRYEIYFDFIKLLVALKISVGN